MLASVPVHRPPEGKRYALMAVAACLAGRRDQVSLTMQDVRKGTSISILRFRWECHDQRAIPPGCSASGARFRSLGAPISPIPARGRPVKEQGTTYSDVLVNLDGRAFEGCEFRMCHLVYSASAPLQLVGCRIIDCTWGLSGAALRTVDFMRVLYTQGEAARLLIENTFDQIRGVRKSLNAQERGV